jgi:hypothetical protein
MFRSIVITAILGILTFMPVQTYGQTQKEVAKERKQINKLSQAELSKKASKSARKDAKKYAKEGWQVASGYLPLKKQLDKLYLMQYEYDENNNPKYLIADAMSIAEKHSDAKMQAIYFANLEFAELIKRKVTALTEYLIGKLLTAEQGDSIIEIISNTPLPFGRPAIILDMYRIRDNKKEVYISVAYNSDKALEDIKKTLRNELEKRGNTELSNQLDNLLSWDK